MPIAAPHRVGATGAGWLEDGAALRARAAAANASQSPADAGGYVPQNVR
jgi:hypothetical protein